MIDARIRLSSDDLQQCIHCGMCLEACPTYRLTGLETESPRGRIHLMQAFTDGRAAPGGPSRVHLDRCLACLACEAVCPSGVAYGRLIETARAELARADGARPGARGGRLRSLVLRGILAHPLTLDLVARILSVYARTGLRAALRRSGLADRLPAPLRRLEALYPPLDRPRYRPPAAVTAGPRVALLLGCVMRVAYGDVHTAAARLLATNGVSVVDVRGQACCGALHAHAGDDEAARDLARRNIEAFEGANVEAIVVDAAGCGAHMKRYADLLRDDDAWADRAAAFAARVRDVNEYLAPLVAGRTVGRLPLRVTYQDPCHLAHAQRIRAEPRALLRAVEGLELAEMRDAEVCCGSAGFYNLAQPAYADRLLDQKLDAILETRPDAVVTANPGCMLQLEAGLRARGARIPVLHVVEVLDRAARAKA